MTGLIYAAIIAMWAVVLVPMWLRGHDRASESRSIDRFEGAMRTLRRGPSLARRNAQKRESDTQESAIRESPVELAQVGAATESVRIEPASAERPSPESVEASHRVGSAQARLRVAARARQRAASRRRVVLISLGAVLVVVGALVATHRLATIALAVPAVLIVGFAVIARRQVRLANDSRLRLERSLALGTQARGDTSARRSRKSGQQRSRLQSHLDSFGEEAPIDIEDIDYDSDAWEAVPTTLPTYVTAPAATRIPRVIDLTTPGSWNGQAMVDQAYGVESLAAQANSGIYDQIDDGVWDGRVGDEVQDQRATFSDRFVEDEHDVDFAIDEEIDTRFVRRAVND